MKNTDNTNNNAEISEELFPTDMHSLPAETFNNFIESLITENPELKKLSLIEFKDNPKFQQALQDYLTKSSDSASALDILKSIIPKNYIKPNNKLANKKRRIYYVKQERFWYSQQRIIGIRHNI